MLKRVKGELTLRHRKSCRLSICRAEMRLPWLHKVLSPLANSKDNLSLKVVSIIVHASLTEKKQTPAQEEQIRLKDYANHHKDQNWKVFISFISCFPVMSVNLCYTTTTYSFHLFICF